MFVEKNPLDFFYDLLLFTDVPRAVVTFGRSLNPKNILEGADVYFECHVKSNPPFYNITWRNNVSIPAFAQCIYAYRHVYP